MLAMYCASYEYPPHDYIIRIIGLPPNSSVSVNETDNEGPSSSKPVNGTDSTNNGDEHEEEEHRGWSRSDKIQLGCAVGLGFPALVIAALTLWRSWHVFDWSKNPPRRLMQSGR